MNVLVRYLGKWGKGDLLCSDPMMLGLVECHGKDTRIWIEGECGNVIHNPLVSGRAAQDLVPDRIVEVRLFTHMGLEEYGRLEAKLSLVDHMCSYAGVRPSDARPKLHLGPQEHEFLRRLQLETLPGPRVAICADHVDPLRHWPVERWREVAKQLAARGATILEIGTKDALGVGADLVGKLTLRQTAAVLTQCDLFLGNNSGPFHYAQAAGCTCVVLFSLATPRRFIHPGARVFAVQADELPCIDCMTRRFAAMQRLGCVTTPHGKCMTMIETGRVLRVVENAYATISSQSLAFSS